MHKSSKYKEELKILSSQQQKKLPVRISEYLQYDEYCFDEDVKQNPLRSLSSNTLSYMHLLEPEYQKKTAMEGSIINLLIQMNRKRNGLHFFQGSVADFDNTIVAEWKDLIDFVNDKVIEYQHSLVKNLNYSNHRKLEKILQ